MRTLLVSSWLIAWLMSATTVKAQADYFLSSKDTIQALDSARLSWHISGVTRVFISGIGETSPDGQAYIKPFHTTNYELIGRKDTSWISKTVKIAVNGIRGKEDYLDKNLFSYENILELPTAKLSVDEFLNKTIVFFQNNGFIVQLDNDLREGSKFTIRTKLAKSAALLQSTTEFQKWVAYRIDFRKFDVRQYDIDKGTILFTRPTLLQCVIQPLVEFNRTLMPVKDRYIIYSNDKDHGHDYIDAAVNLKKILFSLK